MAKIETLEQLIVRLLGEGGCPWDKAQTPLSLAPYLIEEAAEAAQAIAGEGPDKAKEELGDLLFQVIFTCILYEKQDLFSLDDAIEAVREKMIRRHPHVFGTAQAGTPEEVKANWNKIKINENGPETGLLDSVPKGLPGLLRAHRLSARTASAGLDRSEADILNKVDEELTGVKSALGTIGGKRPSTKKVLAEQLGDLFFSLADLARRLGYNAEQLIQSANDKFQKRVDKTERMIKERGGTVSETNTEELTKAWEKMKRTDGDADGQPE
jgi:tetrapyrrole methylase family protein/MazG family protein/ATP diphosphatase